MLDHEFDVPLYEYKDLDEAADEIRIAHIQPGAFDDVIRVSITHVPFKAKSLQRGLGEQAMSKVRNTLSDGWLVGQTTEDRLLYWKENEDYSRITSYDHPNSDCTITWESLAQEESGLEDHDVAADFEALSYVWGAAGAEGDPETIILIEQDSSTQRLAVTPNLFEALKYLRLEDKQRSLWIDAICINQHHIYERNRQVHRMAQIYARARAVVAFLGLEGDRGVANAFSALEKLHSQVVYTRCQKSFPRPGCLEKDWWSTSGELPLSAEDFAAIGQLNNDRAWFRRVWTLQEIELANPKNSVLQCGHKTVSWTAFRQGISTLAYKSQLPPEYSAHLSMLHLLCQETVHQPFEVTMNYTSALRQCSNPRDVVYGTLSMAPEQVAAEVEADYTLPLADIFKSLVIAYCQFQNRCGLLRFCGVNVSHRQEFLAGDWPSWVPRWSVQPPLTVQHSAAYHASGPSPVEAWIRGDNQERLILRGVFLGSVPPEQANLKPLKGLDDSIAYLKHARHVFEERYPDESQKDELRDRTDLYILAICRGLIKSRMPHLDYATLEDWRALITEPSASEIASKHGSSSASLPPRYRGLIDGFSHVNNNYKLFGITGRMIGVASVSVQVDDQVFLPLGCESPIVVRSCPEKDGFQVIGEAYVQGMMDGEALMGKMPPSWSIRVQHNEPGRFSTVYHDETTNSTWQGWNVDPRVKKIDMPPDWEGINYTWNVKDPQAGAKFRNKKTGEIINYDPRFDGESLKARGINVEKITLV